jgi:hypothetical protein
VYFVSRCHETCNNYEVFHVRTYFLCFPTKCHETCNNYEVFHVRTYFLRFPTECHETCNNFEVFHVRTYFLCFPTKCHETCNSYQVFHVRILYLLISGIYQHLRELAEWDHLHSLQPLKSAPESAKFCGSETNCSFSRMSS